MKHQARQRQQVLRSRFHRQRWSASGPVAGGFSLLSTLFVLVVLASLAGFMTRLSSVQSTTGGMSIQASRAWYMALSGMEWAVYQINTTGCPASIPASFSAEGFNISVTRCQSYPVAEGGGAGSNYNLYDVAVTASAGSVGSADYVSTTHQATVKYP